ncbi:carbohydrate ABC transporter permease [Nocardiopsis mangrovi]|uniref:Carbohydrate ABC transporter permease n=1 Tax=Nocardiopsis mangrovi TaxID=1179818 RepID=A0ABV9DU93_9ACTN
MTLTAPAQPRKDGAPPDRGRRTLGASARRSMWATAAAMLLPAVIALALLRLWPSISAIAASLRPEDGRPVWYTFERLFADPTFIGSLKVTLLFGVIINPLQIALALWLAVTLSKRVPAAGLWRTLILLPVAVPQTVSAIVWSVAFRPEGPLNGVANALGLPSIPFLTSPDTAMFSIIVVCSWVGVGYWMTFLVAGVKDIPRSLYEAAAIDGAGAWNTFRHITLPGLRRPLMFVLVADTVSNFLVFAPVQILTQGGPEGSTDLIMNQVFERAYVTGDTATASAGTVVLIAIVLAVVVVQFRLLPGKD